MDRLLRAWQSRAPHERAIIAALALALGAIVYAWLALSAGRARIQLQSSVAALRLQVAQLERQAAELGHLRAAPPPAPSQTDLRALVQAQAGAAGLSRALQRIDVTNADEVVVVLGAVAFADWLDFLASLNSQYVRLDTGRIEALSTPGLVSVTATLVRARAR